MTEENMQESIIEFSEDITNAEAPPPLPMGTYRGEIRAVEAKVSKNSGNRYAMTTFYVAPEEYPADYDVSLAPEGTNLKYNMTSLEDTPKGRFSLRRYCETIGAPTSKSINLNDWLGLEAILEVSHQEYEDMQIATIIKIAAA